MISDKSGSRRAYMFGSNAENVINAIRSQRFYGEVIGPIGMHLALNEAFPCSNNQIENLLGGFMNNCLITLH